MAGLGERFRAAREARGLSLSEVSEQIRIRSVYLAAIEEERWSAIGAPVYVRGFLRTYARFLSLDPETVVGEFNAETQPPPSETASVAEAEAPEPLRPGAPRTGPVLVWAAAIVAVLLVAFVVYNELTLRRGQPAAVALATASPSPVPPAASPLAGPTAGAISAGANTLALVFSQPTWLRVTVDGSVSMEGTFPAGTTKTFHGRKALVRLGNAGGVEIYVDGKSVGRLGKSGDVAERAFTL
jgi:cytoskeleton protein RodZ